MAEYYGKELTVKDSVQNTFFKIKTFLSNETRWGLLFENNFEIQAELVYLSNEFKGAGFFGGNVAERFKSLIVIKLIEEKGETKITIITGGAHNIFEADFGRHKRNVNKILEIFKTELKQNLGEKRWFPKNSDPKKRKVELW